MFTLQLYHTVGTLQLLFCKKEVSAVPISQKGSNYVKFRKKEVTTFCSQIFLCQVGFITLLEETEQDLSQVTF